MPWTASRSRDEWLAEVRRRGERLRRRRRLLVALAGVVAVALPAAGALTLLEGPGDQAVQLNVAGPAPAAVSTTAPDDLAPPTTVSAGAGPTDTVEVHRRIAAINGSPVPVSPGSTVPATGDTLDVRAVHDRPVAPGSQSTPGAASSAASPAAAPPATTVPDDAPACAPAAVRVTVATDKPVYAPGETVHVVSMLQNRSALACRVPTRAHVVHIDDPTGRLVRDFPMTLDLAVPTVAQPGATFTTTFAWDQQDCSGASCVQAPAGTYVAVAEWAEGAGPFVGRGSFQVGS